MKDILRLALPNKVSIQYQPVIFKSAHTEKDLSMEFCSVFNIKYKMNIWNKSKPVIGNQTKAESALGALVQWSHPNSFVEKRSETEELESHMAMGPSPLLFTGQGICRELKIESEQ